MNFIKLGNHVIAPAGTEPTAIVTSSDAAETLNLARLLESKVKELERTADERKTRRKEWKTRVDRLDRILVSLREQDAKEGEKLDKLFKRWNKTTLTSQRHTLDPVFSTRDPSRYDPASGSTREVDTRYPCPTTQVVSAFNGNRECYRDTYTFSGSGWQATAGAGSHVSSPPSSPSAYTSDDRNRFCLTIPTEVSESRRDAEGFSGVRQPRERGEHNWGVGVLADIRNALQDSGERNGRKRINSDFEVDPSCNNEPQFKKMKSGDVGVRRRGSRRDGGNNSRKSRGGEN